MFYTLKIMYKEVKHIFLTSPILGGILHHFSAGKNTGVSLVTQEFLILCIPLKKRYRGVVTLSNQTYFLNLLFSTSKGNQSRSLTHEGNRPAFAFYEARKKKRMDGDGDNSKQVRNL